MHWLGETENDHNNDSLSWSLATEESNNPFHHPPRPHHRAPHAAESSFFFNVNFFNLSSDADVIFAPFITILLAFLQSSGTNNPSPSTSHLRPLAFTLSLGCSVAYFSTLAAKIMFPAFAPQCGKLMSIFGTLAVSSPIALTLHLPDWTVLIMIFSMGVSFKLLNKLHANIRRRRYPHPRTVPPLLPLVNVNIFTHSH